MIQLGCRDFQIRTKLRTRTGSKSLRISEHLSGKRELFIQEVPVRRSSDFIREFHTVVFAPEDRMTVAGSSGFRRRFFDILISEIEPEYLLRLSRYNRALIQRNRALKTAPRTAAAFEEELAEQAPYIAAARCSYAASVAGECAKLLNGKGEFSIIHRTDSGTTPEEHRKLFEMKRDSEIRRQCTLSGAQLDEFDMYFNGKLLRTYGSTGQIRLISMMLKLAQFNLVSRHSPVPVAVLADDVTGELDEANYQLFLNTISGAKQCFFTFAETPRFTLPDQEIVSLS
jgi:DNA replication and repair protein RecF